MKVMNEAKSRVQIVKLCKLFFLRDTSAEHGLHFLHAWDQISSNTVLKLQLHISVTSLYEIIVGPVK